MTIPAGGPATVSVSCPAGFTASDAMWSGDGTDALRNVRIVRSQRTGDGAGWSFTLWNDASTPLAYAVGVGCMRVSR